MPEVVPTDGRPLIAVVDYGIGNLGSAQKALVRVGADARLTSDAGLIADADGVVLPGVGAFGRCMEALRDAGLAEATSTAARAPQPFLGICVGMQMLYESSVESPGVDGLGVLPGKVVRLAEGVKHPQMQWNELRVVVPVPLLAGLDGAWAYFVHSYAAEDRTGCIATCEYGGEVVAAVQQGTVAATQFHPEKSGPAGLALLANFVTWVGEAR